MTKNGKILDIKITPLSPYDKKGKTLGNLNLEITQKQVLMAKKRRDAKIRPMSGKVA